MTNKQIQATLNKINEKEEQLTAKILDKYYSSQEQYKSKKKSTVISNEDFKNYYLKRKSQK